MRNVTIDAELEKLAHILEVPVDELDFLRDLDPHELRTVREGVTEALFARFRPTFAGFARLASLLPLMVSTRIAKRVLGPTLSARVAGEMPPQRALELAARLSDDFLAQTCLQLDPQRAQPIVSGFPAKRAVAITRLLADQRAYVTMGEFVDVLPEETLYAATDALTDTRDLLRVSCFVANEAQLERVVCHLDHGRREALIHAAAQAGLWPEVVTVLRRISTASRQGLTELALAQDNTILDSLIRAAAAHDLWPDLLELGKSLGSAGQQRLAAHPALAEADVVCSVIDSVAAHALWPEFGAQVDAMGEQRCQRLLEVAAEQRPLFIAELVQRIEHDDVAVAALRNAMAGIDDVSRRQLLDASADTGAAALLTVSS